MRKRTTQRMKDPIRVTTATKIWRRIRNLFSRTEWAVWLLGLKRNECQPVEPGLVIIQIDGLSKQQFDRAIQSGRMPFAKSLIEKEKYRNHLFYSGLPSSTPAVQAELFYGVPTVVPAFGFRDQQSGNLVRMFASEIACRVEQRLSESGDGLLAGGSSYSNVYGGGADEVHFCATSFGWSEFLSTLNPLQIALVMLLNFWMFARIVGLMALEFFLASFDFVRGIVSGRRFWQELLMIPARVVVVVLLRELVTIGASYDVARGLPIIHLNLLGYDEQAHRRGPESRFAHWTLRGIDRGLRRVWNAAHRGSGREYDFWIFSDHGQESTRPYEIEHGQLVQQVIAEVVESIDTVTVPLDEVETEDSLASSRKTPRFPTPANWIGLGWLVTMLFGEQDHDIQTRSRVVQTVTSGPVGFVYLLTDAGRSRRDEIAVRLVESKIPMCAYLDPQDHLTVVNRRGTFRIPEQAAQVFGDHPFIDELPADLERMVRHADSGEIVFFGWDGEQPTASFVLQNGAHAGPGIEETSAFALLPADTQIPENGRGTLRPNDLRLAALEFLGREQPEPATRFRPIFSGHQETVRILSYNVHACVGMDGQLSPRRIARVIAQSETDIVCLQELDVLRNRSGKVDQAHAIARELEMSHQFHPAWHLEEEQFGNAILTRFPMEVVRLQSLHHHRADRSRRSALSVRVMLSDGVFLDVINTHLSIYHQEQKIQARQLLDQWVRPSIAQGPVVLCGDFNAGPGSATHGMICQELRDVESFDSNRARRTLFSPFPIARVDHAFVSRDLVCQRVEVIDSRLAKMASDHLPLLFEIKVQAAEQACGSRSDVPVADRTGQQHLLGKMRNP